MEKDVLERIAIALERIATRLETMQSPFKPKTNFPWSVVSNRTSKAVSDAVHLNFMGEFDGCEWPLTCEDLMRVGRIRMLRVKGMGAKGMNEIESLLVKAGFNWNA